MVPYADIAYATTYFLDRLNTAPWDDADTTTRNKSLKMATRAIDRLNFAGVKADSTQVYQFPRGADVAVPTDIQDACCELALALLDGADPNLAIENQRDASAGIGDARTTQDTSYSQAHIMAGIPSIQAWSLLYPYLRDPNEVRMIRDSYKLGDPQSFV